MSAHNIVLYCQMIIFAGFWLHKDPYFVLWEKGPTIYVQYFAVTIGGGGLE